MHRLAASGLPFALLLTGSTGLEAHDDSSNAGPVVRYLSADGLDGGAQPVAINGNTVVWYGEKGREPHPYFGFFIGKIGHWEPRRLPGARILKASSASQAFLSSKWLLWLDQTLPYTGIAWGISAFNLTTHRTYRLATSAAWGVPNADYNYPTISLSGDTAAFGVVACSKDCVKPIQIHSMIVVQKLPRGKPRIVASKRGNCQVTWPSISGHIVVFQREGLCYGNTNGCTASTCKRNRGSDVEMLNLQTGKTKMLTHNRGSSEPVTNGRFVAWKQGRPGSTRFDDGAIELMEIGSRHSVPISLTIPGGYETQCLGKTQRIGTIETCADSPAIDGRIVTWSIASGAFNEARDIATGHEYLLTTSARHISVDISQISGHYAPWAELNEGMNSEVAKIGLAWVP